MQQTPRQLVVQAQRRDPAAFAGLIALHERAALAIAFAILSDASTAGDAVQEAFIRIWQRLPGLNDPEKFAGWMTQVVRNVSLDHRRRRAKERADVEPLERSLCDDPSAAMEQRETSERIETALAELDETTRMILTLRYYESLSSKQIGERLNLSPAAVDTRLSRGRQAMRLRLCPTNANE